MEITDLECLDYKKKKKKKALLQFTLIPDQINDAFTDRSR